MAKSYTRVERKTFENGTLVEYRYFTKENGEEAWDTVVGVPGPPPAGLPETLVLQPEQLRRVPQEETRALDPHMLP
jgi:hypothetical protein